MHADGFHPPLTRIASILPKGEGFSAAQFGAIALCVRDFTRFSRFRDDTLIIGGTTREGFGGLRYEKTQPARWYQNRTRAYAGDAAAILKRNNITLAEIHNRPVLLNLIARSTSCALALHLHNDPQEMEGTRTPQERARLLTRAGGVYCVSGYIRDRFAEGLPAGAADKLHIAYPGMELPQAPLPKENCILFVGRMTEGKGALLLAQALAIALPQLPDWHAMLIGSDRHEAGNPPTLHEQEIAQALAPLGAQVTLSGFLSHPETLAAFGSAAIAVVPSVWEEPFGRTALEAMACGCAVISSGRGGLREVTANAALTPESMTPQGLAEAILRVAGNEPLRSDLQRQGQSRARAFDISICAATLDAARSRILSGVRA